MGLRVHRVKGSGFRVTWGYMFFSRCGRVRSGFLRCGSEPLILWFPGLGSPDPGPLVPWSSGPLVSWSSGLSILRCLVSVFGRLEILPITAFGAEKTGPVQITIFVAFEMRRLCRSQETANTVFADLERLRML